MGHLTQTIFNTLKQLPRLLSVSVTYGRKHPVIGSMVVLAVLVGGWWAYGKATTANAEVRYVLGTVEKGTVVASVSASGQVSASNQLDVKPKASGDVVYVGVLPGQKVKAGTLLVQLDAADALKSVRDAESNLESAQISLEKLQKPASALSMTQAQNALTNAQDALAKLYTDSATDVTNAFLDMPDIVTGLEGILIDDDASAGQWNEDVYANAIMQYDLRGQTFKSTAHSDYNAAKAAYDTAFNEYQSLGSTPDNASVEKALADSYTAVQLLAKALKSANAFIQLYVDIYKAHNRTPVSAATGALTDLNSYTSKVNSHLSSLLSDTNSLKQDRQDITEKQQSLDETVSGADPLDLRSSQLSVTKAQNALQDAKSNLADYYVRAPFDATVATVNVKKYDSASSGTAVATLITAQKIAELSLNEVDAAKIKIGDKATLTFDAIEGLTLTGQVAQVDTIGAVSQGVVSYTVKISFDSQDDRIKSGMTVNAAIITDAHQDVLMVPGSAVKTVGGTSAVMVFSPALQNAVSAQGVTSSESPQMVPVEVGISDDTNTEILSGLNEGEQIVVRTVTQSTQTTTQNASSLFGGNSTRSAQGGARGGAGGTFFIQR